MWHYKSQQVNPWALYNYQGRKAGGFTVAQDPPWPQKPTLIYVDKR